MIALSGKPLRPEYPAAKGGACRQAARLLSGCPTSKWSRPAKSLCHHVGDARGSFATLGRQYSHHTNENMEALTPIHTAPLFPAIHAELIGLLRGLDEEDWERPTLARAWRVRDVVAHLLDGDLRKLSGGRD